MQEADKNGKSAVPQPQPEPAQPRLAEGAAPPELHKALDFFERHGTALLVVSGIALAVVLGVTLFRRYAATTRQQASSLLHSVTSVQDLDNLVSRYGSTPAAPLAELKLAKTYFDAGNYEAAASRYDEFSKNHPDHPMALVAVLGRIHCTEAMGQTDQALAAFSSFLEQHPKHFLSAQALFGKGRCLETLGKTADARTLYEDALAAEPDGPWAPRLEEQIASVKRRMSRLTNTAAAGKAELAPPVLSPVTNPAVADPATNTTP
jgi:predicted negative regulator of RcsB-dependent stress response